VGLLDISVVIPTFNRAAVLRRTLLLYERQQAMHGRFEVLVVDDGSSDGTPALLEAMARELRYPMRWFSLPGNAGPSAARNRALDEARGRLLFFTGDDILPDEHLLAEHVKWHDEHHPASHVGVLGQVQWAEELAATPFMRWLESSGAQFGYGRLAHGQAADYGFLYTSNVSVKRDFVVATKERFDERLRFCEDSEWGLRLARKGFELRYNAQARGGHLHLTTVDSSIRRMHALGRAAATLREVSPENFQRITSGVFEPGARARLRLLRTALHPAVARTLYLPLARLCERRVVVDRLFAACHAAYFLDGLVSARQTRTPAQGS
jgi:glycosyltransferase involved in cell wall biosynthesis